MQKKLLATVVASLMATQAMAIEVVNDGTNTFSIGGRVGVQTENKDGNNSVNNDSARINFAFESKLTEATTGFATVEWAYKAQNEYTKVGGGFTAEEDLFSNRLGYVGIKNDTFGALSMGKQWSVYSDVAMWTDQFAIGGGQAMGMYNGFNSDGGANGTGRADDAIAYRIGFGGLQVGAQYQIEGDNFKEGNDVISNPGNVKRKDGYQLAASYTLEDIGLSFGAAYNETKFDANVSSTATADRQDITAKAAVVAVKYAMNDLYLAATYGEFRNQTTTSLGNSSAVVGQENFGLDKKSKGTEIYGKYTLSSLLDGGISLQTGWNKLDVKEDNTGADSDAKIDKRMVGAIYAIGPMQFAAEYTWDKSRDSNNKQADDYFTVQARYYF